MRKKKTIQIENNPSLERDIESRAVINSDTSAYHAFINRKRVQKNRDLELNMMKNRIVHLESELIRISSLVEKLTASSNDV